MKPKIILAVVVAVALFAAYTIVRQERGSDADLLTFHGNVEIRTVSLAPRFLGEIVKIAKDEGEAVTAGEALVFLDDTTIRHGIAETQARIAAAEASLKKLRSGFRAEEIAEAEATRNEARAVMAKAKDLYERQQALYDKQAISQERYIQAKLGYEQANAAYGKASALYALRQKGYRSEDIAAQEAQVTALKAALASLQHDLEKAIIRAPVDGVILNRFKEPGSVAAPGERILEVAETGQLWVQAYMDEPYLGKVRPGDRMLIRSDASATPYEGRVGFVSPIAEFTPKNVETRDLRTDLVFRFRVLVDAPDDTLRQGMPVTLERVE
jgi:HlyD family secretion protein